MTRTIHDYAAAVASGDPTPGGGSVIATVAAFAAGLAEMVCHLTLARPSDPEVTVALTGAQQTAAHLRTRFLQSATADEVAYGAYRNAAALPKATSEEREARRHALESALETSAAVPLRVAGDCVELLTTLETVAALGTKHARADVVTSLRLTDASLKSALDMVRANTELMRDHGRAASLDQEANTLRSQGEATATALIAAIGNQPG